ncbi:hypothetical protein RB2150_10274 [Rhodobacterales bacterium HTCC2150]|jgi:hypothetical protein|nr:hypothetical protein RB2150_10274 [Rhodobacterales bacterium HTCC2150] [Rhodobacteraceae bacterium HTCC2150]MDG1338432.1 hypothetical protein [Paracoccaceae bacterium]
MTPERLEAAYNLVLEMLKSREDGRKLVPIAKHLERELQALHSDEEDYERYLRIAQQ